MEDKNAHIPTSEVEQDIEDTQREINMKKQEISALRMNPQENRTRIYLAEGYISKREHFITKLREILNKRKIH